MRLFVLLQLLDAASGLRRNVEIIVNRFFDLLTSGRSELPMDNSPVTAVARATCEPGCVETIESVRHRGTRDTGVMGQDRHRGRRRLRREQQNEYRELEIAQLVMSEDTPETAAQSFGGAQMSKSERAARDIYPVSPVGEREE